jgi:hypothetical protein
MHEYHYLLYSRSSPILVHGPPTCCLRTLVACCSRPHQHRRSPWFAKRTGRCKENYYMLWCQMTRTMADDESCCSEPRIETQSRTAARDGRLKQQWGCLKKIFRQSPKAPICFRSRGCDYPVFIQNGEPLFNVENNDP